jgi:hypothetical protein
VFRDARNGQLLGLSTFLLFGVWFLDWDDAMRRFLIFAPTALSVQLLAIRVLKLPVDSLKSALITSFSLTMMLQGNEVLSLMMAAILAIGSKFLIRLQGKHVFNPANLGIVLSILLSGETWISPGRWGSSILYVILIGIAGILILSKAQRMDTGLSFLIALFLLDASRFILYQGWEWDVLMHKYLNGTLLLFSFFMITDPVVTPNHRSARILWACLVAGLSFYLQSFVQLHTAPIWALFLLSPLTPLLDRIWKAQTFEWLPKMRSRAVPLSLILLMAFQIMGPSQAKAFCGFYVAKADAKLFNNSSQVILVRDGQRSVVTMHSDFEGNVRDFAMVVPVPVVLKRDQIRIIEASVFRSLDAYSGPRLVEYYDENPCYERVYVENEDMVSRAAPTSSFTLKEKAATKKDRVTIEAKYSVGEYDILLLSAQESGGLKNWLLRNGYKIPDQAETVLEPYIKSNMKFFVVKVNLEEQVKLGVQEIRPIQIEFDSPKFMLPIRLGMANARSDQDMIVYAFSKQGRVECTNYRTEKIPTDRKVPLDVAEKFPEFYKALFNKRWKASPDAVFLEYAWNVTPSWGGMKCDPCVGPPPLTTDLSACGVNWSRSGAPVYFTRLHVRYGRSYFPQDLVFQETPNRENFQGRYIITHPAVGDLQCNAGQNYLKEQIRQRQREVQNLSSLTGWNTSSYGPYIHENLSQIKKPILRQEALIPESEEPAPNSERRWWFSLMVIATVLILILRNRR